MFYLTYVHFIYLFIFQENSTERDSVVEFSESKKIEHFFSSALRYSSVKSCWYSSQWEAKWYENIKVRKCLQWQLLFFWSLIGQVNMLQWKLYFLPRNEKPPWMFDFNFYPKEMLKSFMVKKECMFVVNLLKIGALMNKVFWTKKKFLLLLVLIFFLLVVIMLQKIEQWRRCIQLHFICY